MDNTAQGVCTCQMVHAVLAEALARKLRDAGRIVAVARDTALMESGLIDSQDLLDLILEVEERCGRVFDPECFDGGDAITLAKLAGAFTAP